MEFVRILHFPLSLLNLFHVPSPLFSFVPLPPFYSLLLPYRIYAAAVPGNSLLCTPNLFGQTVSWRPGLAFSGKGQAVLSCFEGREEAGRRRGGGGGGREGDCETGEGGKKVMVLYTSSHFDYLPVGLHSGGFSEGTEIRMRPL